MVCQRLGITYPVHMSLIQRMAEFGFETNEDYSLPLRLLLERPTQSVRTLNITGEAGRRKTAFANALGAALDVPNVLYHDFIQHQVPAADTQDKEGQQPAIDPFDRVMSEGCALSEGERTIIILDQLQATTFAQHLRLYDFVKTLEWSYLDTTAVANLHNLLLFVISEEPLYHSLQKLSLRVWVDSAGSGRPPYRPGDFGRDLRISQTMERLADVFELLEVVPTRSEYEKILFDIDHFVRTPQALIKSIYGWTEGTDYAHFKAPAVLERIDLAISAIHEYIGMESLDDA